MSHTIYYHGECKVFWGRAWAPIAIMKHAGKEFSVLAPDQVAPNCGFAPPWIKVPSGETFAQTNVITAYLGRQCGLAPAGEIADCQAMQLLEDSSDIFTEIGAEKPAERINKWLVYLTSRMHASSGFFFENLSYADFGLYIMIDSIVAKKGVGKLADIELGEKLTKWHAVTMAAIPAVAEMKGSGIPILPAGML